MAIIYFYSLSAIFGKNQPSAILRGFLCVIIITLPRKKLHGWSIQLFVLSNNDMPPRETPPWVSWKKDTQVIPAVMKLQIKPRKNSEVPKGFEPVTSAIQVRCSTDWAMKSRWKQVKCEFNLYPERIFFWVIKLLHNGEDHFHFYSLSAIWPPQEVQ